MASLSSIRHCVTGQPQSRQTFYQFFLKPVNGYKRNYLQNSRADYIVKQIEDLAFYPRVRCPVRQDATGPKGPERLQNSMWGWAKKSSRSGQKLMRTEPNNFLQEFQNNLF